MKIFNTGAMREAMDRLGGDGPQRLVERTLARHGLRVPDHATGFRTPFPEGSLQGAAVSGNPFPGATFPGMTPDTQAAEIKVPAGASFTASRFDCAAGGRDYMVYVPSSAGQGGVQGLVMMLHGCTQNPADFARGTGMNELAEQHRLVVVYPHQSRGNNAQSCWNWFSPGDQRRGRGEPEILAQMASHLATAHDVPRDRIFAAGLSAGAAMAVILGQTHPEVFGAVGAHSGLPFGAAKDVPGAFATMNTPADAPGRAKTPTPAIVFHGTADRTVHPQNGAHIVADTLAAGPEQTVIDRTTAKTRARTHTREATATMEGQVLVEHWVIDGLGHAWSGGQPGGSYTDPKGPNASAEMVRFFMDQPRRTRPV